MLKHSIFNNKAIHNAIVERRKAAKKAPEANMYEKINQTFQGRLYASPELIDETIALIEEKSKEAVKYLKDKKKEVESL